MSAFKSAAKAKFRLAFLKFKPLPTADVLVDVKRPFKEPPAAGEGHFAAREQAKGDQKPKGIAAFVAEKFCAVGDVKGVESAECYTVGPLFDLGPERP